VQGRPYAERIGEKKGGGITIMLNYEREQGGSIAVLAGASSVIRNKKGEEIFIKTTQVCWGNIGKIQKEVLPIRTRASKIK